MAHPTICLLLPTVGRPQLARMLRSLLEQELAIGDEVLLVSDDHHDFCAGIWASATLPGRHIPLTDGPHKDWGHTPRNRILPQIRADFVLHIDDDDVLLPGAMNLLRDAARMYPRDFHVFPFIRHRDQHLVGSERVLAHGFIGT